MHLRYLPLIAALLSSGAWAEEPNVTKVPHSASKQSEKDICLAKFNEWLRTFSASDPIGAWNQNSEWLITKTMVKQAQQASSDIKFARPLNFQGKQCADIQSGSPLEDIFKIYQKTLDQRDESIVRNMRKVIDQKAENAKPPLKVIFAGENHVVDYWLSLNGKASDGVVFAQPKIGADSKYLTPQTLALNRKISGYINDQLQAFKGTGVKVPAPDNNILEFRHPELNGTADSQSAGYVTALLSRVSKLKTPYTYVRKKDSLPSAIVISDLHDLNSPEVIANLPSAACLDLLGYAGIDVGLEGFAPDKPLNHQMVDLAANQALSIKVRSGAPKALARLQKEEPELYRAFEKNQLTETPNFSALAAKIKDWSEKGTVHIEGLEDGGF